MSVLPALIILTLIFGVFVAGAFCRARAADDLSDDLSRKLADGTLRSPFGRTPQPLIDPLHREAK